MRIWIVEDDKSCQFTYQSMLAGSPYQPIFFEDLEDFTAAVRDCEPPFLVIADLLLKKSNFLDFFSQDCSRRFFSDFIVVSSLDDMAVMRECYEEGALDCLTKPFNKNELLVKIERILQRKSIPATAPEPPRSKVSVNSRRLEAYFEGKVVPLTHKECQILYNFTHSEAITKEQLIESIWSNVNVGRKTLDVHLYNLRKKLRPIGLSIQFEKPNFYKMHPPFSFS